MIVTKQPPTSIDHKTLKRTRVLNVKQSKLGCYTCKKRRIKCDEGKPSCLRCQRSGRVCGGYPVGSSPADSSSSSSTVSRRSYDHFESPPSDHSPPESLNLIPWSSSEQRRLSGLACTVLGSDPHSIHSPSNAAVFAYMLPQLSLTVPCVSSAAAAFGAAYESIVLRDNEIDASTTSAKQYVNALQLMQNEIREPSSGYIPLLIASMLLAAAETIQHHQKDALHHVLGAFNLFNLRDTEKSNECQDQKATKSKLLMKTTEIDILEDVFRSMDVQIATFVWGKQPFLKSRQLSESMLTSSKVEDLISDQPILIHACLHFVARASEECYQHYDDLPFELIHHQGQLISWLRLWLTRFDLLIKTDNFSSKSKRSPTENRHLHLLKSQVLAILVTISNIKTPKQKSYDRYEREFEQILGSAEPVLGQSDTSGLKNSSSNLPPFSPSPGIIQPLFFLARKCRHSLHRRRAIALLRISGIEGPFNGDLEAAVAERIVEIEEDRPFKPTLRVDEILLANDIPEERRIASCWRLSENDETAQKKSIKLCRRRYPPATGSDYADKDIRWDIWEEQFEFDTARAGGFQTEPSFAQGKQWRALPQESFWSEPELISMSEGIGPNGQAIDASGASRDPTMGRMPAFGIHTHSGPGAIIFERLRSVG